MGKLVPEGFDQCEANGGRIRTKSMGDGQYMHICFLDGKSYPGEMKTAQKDNTIHDALMKYAEKGIQVVVGRLRGRNATDISTVAFDKAIWSEEEAVAWLTDHEMKTNRIDERDGKLYFRQRDPADFDKASFHTITSQGKTTPRSYAEGDGKKPKKGVKPGMEADDDDDDDDDDDEDDKLYDIQGVEIFACGKWNGDEYDEADLTDMVAAFDAVGFQPPLKLGHSDKIGERAYGWVQRVYVKGKKLLADFKDVPGEIYRLIKSRAFDTVSSEIYWNLERDSKTFRRVLKAVALLGSETPAVSHLAPLRTVVNTNLKSAGVHVYNHQPMEWQMEEIKKLTDKIAELEGKLAEASGDKEKLAALTAELVTARAELLKANEVRALEMTALQEQVKTLTASVTTLTQEKRVTSINERVAKCNVPAFRDVLRGLFEIASIAPKTVKFQATDGKEVEKSGEALVEELIASINSSAAKLFTPISNGEHRRGEGGGDERVDIRVERLAREHMQKAGEKDFAKAVNKVLTDDRDLAVEYASYTSGQARH